MKLFISCLVFSALSAQAYDVTIHTHNTVRKLAGEAADASGNDEDSALVYDSPDAKTKIKLRSISPETWNSAKTTPNSRLDYFLKIYYANTKDFSNSGQRHFGCFFGDAENLAGQYFNSGAPIANIRRLDVSVSEDRKMVGVEFEYINRDPKKKNILAHFRLPHCTQGAKNVLVKVERATTAHKKLSDSGRKVAVAPVLRVPAAATTGENGYDTYDKLSKLDVNAEIGKTLPRFKLCSDYNQMKPKPEERPWKGMDIRTEEGGKKFAQLVLDYFYDSLVQDANNTNNNFITENIKSGKTRWCHMPWLNVGDSGRELIHGLTKERDLEKSEIYPNVNSSKEKEGSDWGIGFYNDIACASMHDVFGSDQKTVPPDFANKKFPDGSVSVKILFTTAKLDELNGSFTWIANVSPAKSTSRKLREVKLVQIDVAVKDSTLIGTKKEIDHWMMTTFYYDASYLADSIHRYSGHLAGLLKMRPIGIQTGFDPSTSLIFAGSKTNSADNVYYGASPKLMNGPADNPKGSCLSCHGAAGTSVKMVPGVKDFDQYMKIKDKGLDFSQQMALAKRNYETRYGQKKASR